MWEKIEDPMRYLARLHLPGGTFRGARKQTVPFYPNGYLVQMLFEGGACMGVASEDELIWLDGTSRLIDEANRVIGLSLDETNVAQYLDFFCHHIEAEEGSFAVQAVIGAVERNEAGDYLLQCVLEHAEHRFLTEMRVGQDGGVEMLDDEVIDGPSVGAVH